MAGRNAAKRTTPRRTTAAAREARATGVAGSPSVTVTSQGGDKGVEAEGGSKGKWGEFVRFMKSVRVEWRRVTWPDKNQLRAATMAVMFTLIIFASYLGFLDWVLIKFFTGGKH